MRDGYRATAIWILAALALGWTGCSSTAAPPDSGGEDGGTSAPDCVPGEPPIPVTSLPVCELCPDARCVPDFALDDDQRSQLLPCSESSTCVPELFIETNGNFTLEKCTSVQGAEGRCLSVCVPAVANQSAVLPQDVCEDGWLCAPCYDPVSGADTGACTQGCDTGPTEEPVAFPECCDGLGACVPSELVSPEQAGQLGVDSCTGDGVLCAPRELADPSFQPEQCDSVGGAEGRCLPECLPDIGAQSGVLPQAMCPDGHLCAPCYDPTTGEDTQACRINGDAPVNPPFAFPECCGSLGLCVPAELVPEEQRQHLDDNGCSSGELCAPKVFIEDPDYQPGPCTAQMPGFPLLCLTPSDAGAGVCLPACLPALRNFPGSLLCRGNCPAEWKCAPCEDPISGGSTGACDL
jgi:hypothetical protein